MSCNGCRVLRRGCSDKCILRQCLEWIETPQAQANATLFLSRFFGRTDLMSFISAVPENKRPALFQSLLFEACGRTVNPVNGAVGLFSTQNWHICQAAVETVLSSGGLLPNSIGIFAPKAADHEASRSSAWRSSQSSSTQKPLMHGSNRIVVEESRRSEVGRNCMVKTASSGSGISAVSPDFGKWDETNGVKGVGSKEPKLLNLFA